MLYIGALRGYGGYVPPTLKSREPPMYWSPFPPPRLPQHLF